MSGAPSGALVFIGFMASGKSSAARVAAARAGRAAQDSDRLIEERLGHSIEEEFERGGEGSFRAREEEVVLELLERAGDGDRISLGGGSVLSARVQEALERHTVVLLDIDADTAWQRAEGKRRPLARDRRAFVELHAARAGLYEHLADAIVPARRDCVADALPHLEALAARPRRARLLWAAAASGSYPVWIADGLLDAPPWPLPAPPGRRFSVSDANVDALHARRLGPFAEALVVPAGEEAKSLAQAERLWRALARAGATRADHVAAVGGGVVGDLAGFVAATYQRGMAVVHVPTTLVAQVDSAYGGKTGIDLAEAKNYVGAYHQPAGVLCDPAVLGTLPAAELAAGYAEVIKTALIAGGELWERIAGARDADVEVIASCARVKLQVVAEDERDAGRRQVLNLGHTVGHAIETATGYRRYRHGEAVALGLLAALALSGAAELRAQVRELLSARGLPVALDEGVDLDGVIEALGRDKKRTAGGVPFVLLAAPGEARPGNVVAEADVRAVVADLRDGR